MFDAKVTMNINMAAFGTFPSIPQRQEIGGSVSFSQEMKRMQSDIARTITKGFDEPMLPTLSHYAHATRLQEKKSVSDVKVSFANKRDFISNLLPLAQKASAKIGISEDLILAHAALESGWGEKPIRTVDGSNGYNLFGIKAGLNWAGDKAKTMTKEYFGNGLVKLEDDFRTYDGYQQSFHDYVNLLSGERYQNVIGSGRDAKRFGEELAKAGYATDPLYARKLSEVAAEITALKNESVTSVAQWQ
ncbi:glucosaminidase domain-containing protein [Chromobacterium amazonense]|uniref:glucosaminidase domain-containing protein n=1 Tax=Chromobacterium amazonense TaxID=1382803 RepID=UPI0031F71426